MNKKDKFIKLINEQLNVQLINDKEDIFNQKRNILYTKIENKHERDVLNYLIKHNIVFNKHYKDYYWIYV